MRWLFLVLSVLAVALAAEAVFDSAMAAWIALGSVFGLLAIRLLGWAGLGDFGDE